MDTLRQVRSRWPVSARRSVHRRLCGCAMLLVATAAVVVGGHASGAAFLTASSRRLTAAVAAPGLLTALTPVAAWAATTMENSVFDKMSGKGVKEAVAEKKTTEPVSGVEMVYGGILLAIVLLFFIYETWIQPKVVEEEDTKKKYKTPAGYTPDKVARAVRGSSGDYLSDPEGMAAAAAVAGKSKAKTRS
eukprot:TRINITY_DN7569_c0_g1_i1.p2 TRINITY_DN7569_c0_g1~~TRINITY_DN7569_c0_g1_i1.p2  ORF type:complete len:190 (-),score=51.45 TRINITY_DN7569_c0_g1_i1:150-719(-)